jgi:hypothetical protein
MSHCSCGRTWNYIYTYIIKLYDILKVWSALVTSVYDRYITIWNLEVVTTSGCRYSKDLSDAEHQTGATYVTSGITTNYAQERHTWITLRCYRVRIPSGSRLILGDFSCYSSNSPVQGLQYIIFSNATTCPSWTSWSPSWLWPKCNRLLRLGRPWGVVTLSRWGGWWYMNMEYQEGP